MRAVYRLLGLVRRYGPARSTPPAHRRWIWMWCRSARSPRCSNAPPRPHAAGPPSAAPSRFTRDPAEFARDARPSSPPSRPPPLTVVHRRDRAPTVIERTRRTMHPTHPRAAGRSDRRRPDRPSQGPQARRPQGHPARTTRAGPPARSSATSVPGTAARRRGVPPGITLGGLPGGEGRAGPSMRIDTWNALDDLRYDRSCCRIWRRCGSPRPATRFWFWVRSGSARRTWRPLSGTSRSAAG